MAEMNASGMPDPVKETNSDENVKASKLQDKFYTASKKWRKQINYLQCQIVNQRNIPLLEKESRILEQCMKELTTAQEELENAQDSAVEKMILYGKFEDICRENSQILVQVGETIRELRSKEEDDRYSMTSSRSSRSATSRKPRSKLSRGSFASTSSSARQRRLDLEEEIATLKVKMNLVHERQELEKMNRYALDEIEQRKLEIQNEEKRLMEEIKISKEKLKIKEELAEKEARVEACVRFENEDRSVVFDDRDVENNVQEHIERFLESQVEPTTHPTSESNPPATPSSPQLDLTASVYVPNTSTTSIPAQPHNAVVCTTIPSTQVYTPTFTTDPNVVQAQLSSIAKLLEVQNQNRLPLPEPGIFNGDPLQYPIWIKAFETLIEGRAINPAERLHFLGKYVSGEAKEVVKGFMLLDGEDAYRKAREMLAKRFGDPFTTATAFRKRLEEWKPIEPYDAIGLRKFADFLVQCEKAMEKVSCLNVLNDDQENLKMASKLPKWLSNRWARIVYKSKEEKKRFPLFSEFVQFLVRESNIACDPVNLRIVKNNEDSKRTRDPKRHNPSSFKYRPGKEHDKRNFATRSEENDGKEENRSSDLCQFCKGSHDLNSCKQFRKMDIKDRKKFATDKGLCYGCLGNGHLSKNCKTRKTCDTCKRFHPTSLHGDFKENSSKDNAKPEGESAGTSPTVNCTKACFMSDGSQVRISSMIVPVWIHHSNDPESEKLVYALLDDQSDTTFITQETLKSLTVNGPETQLSLSTMHADNEVIPSHKIKGLTVCDYDHNVSISLPTTFSCTTIPARRTQIPCPEMTSQWPHLASIKKKLMPYQHDIEVGLLIGSNCSRAIMPREIIPGGPGNSPYAQKTDLGWGIIRNVTKSKQEQHEDQEVVHVTHRVISRSITDTNLPHQKTCHFSIKTTTKEVINPIQVRQMMESDFSEATTNEQPLSQDESFCSKWKEEFGREKTVITKCHCRSVKKNRKCLTINLSH